MTVYRIQSKWDRTSGVYHAAEYTIGDGSIIDRMHFEHNQPTGGIDIHPAAYEDIGIKREPEFLVEFHGFNSAADLLRWFKGYIPALLCAGCEIVALNNITITAVGEYQVLFTWND